MLSEGLKILVSSSVKGRWSDFKKLQMENKKSLNLSFSLKIRYVKSLNSGFNRSID